VLFIRDHFLYIWQIIIYQILKDNYLYCFYYKATFSKNCLSDLKKYNMKINLIYPLPSGLLLVNSSCIKKFSFLILLILASLNMMGQGQLTVTATSTDACFQDGTVTSVVSGGTAPYSYIWYSYSPDLQIGTTPGMTGLSDGWYRVDVTDANGLTGSTAVNVNPLFHTFITTTPVSCNDEGSATVSATGGTAPYTYKWSTGQTTATISNLTMGDYSVAVTDANGCENNNDSSAYVYSNSAINITISNVPGDCNNSPSATATATGGAAPYTYYWNTNPIQTTATATGLTAGNNYKVTVTDANGCIQESNVYAYSNLNALDLTCTASPETCGDNSGSASVTPGSGTAPYTYLWSNGMSTQNISGLSIGAYSVTVTDANGCQSWTSVFVDDSSPVTAFVNYNSTCINGNGSATVFASGGTLPYTYSWSDGQTTASVANLDFGTYYVEITDAAGCKKTKGAYIYQPWNCTHSTISGIVFNDINGNCIKDAGENGIANTMVYISPGYGVSTQANGYYYASVAPGIYTVSHIPSSNWTQLCPASPGTITVNVSTTGSDYSNNNFGDQVTSGIQDLEVKLYCGTGRPGGLVSPYLVYTNKGGTAMSGTVSYTHSNLVSFSNSYPPASNYNSGTLTAEWNFVNLLPGEQRWILPQMSIPIPTPLGTQLSSLVSINPAAGDMVLANNRDSCYSTVIGSYDPNDLRVSPQGSTGFGYITSADSVLSYLIRFQNTGTDTAFIVVVRDTLDNHLDPATITDLISSHGVELSVSGNLLKFTFNDIDLLDSTHNEPASHGFVSFRIKIKKATPLGTEIHNKVDIYFDYNQPVITNGVLNTLTQNLTGITASRQGNASLHIFPNPASEEITISYDLLKESIVSVKLFTVLGEEITIIEPVQQSRGSNNIQFSAKDYGLNPGVYILKLYYDEYVSSSKLILTE
jgi:hypothetical protein